MLEKKSTDNKFNHGSYHLDYRLDNIIRKIKSKKLKLDIGITSTTTKNTLNMDNIYIKNLKYLIHKHDNNFIKSNLLNNLWENR